MAVEPYLFREVERIRYGRYPLLDTIVYRWTRRLEETLFTQFRKELYAGASVVEEMRFSTFFGSLRTARPMYLFEMEPFPGQGLLVLDNRFAALCLNGETDEGGATPVETLSADNHRQLQQVVQRLLADFDACWSDVAQVRTHLKKVTTYLFRARILSSYEPCLVAQAHLSGNDTSARLAWCFPRFMLDAVLGEARHPRVIPSLYPEHADRAGGGNLAALPAELDYRVRVSLGSVDLRHAGANLAPGTVVPLENRVGGDAVIEVNGAPLLTGSIGESRGQYAVRITGSYADRKAARPSAAGDFEPIRWPMAIPE